MLLIREVDAETLARKFLECRGDDYTPFPEMVAAFDKLLQWLIVPQAIPPTRGG